MSELVKSALEFVWRNRIARAILLSLGVALIASVVMGLMLGFLMFDPNSPIKINVSGTEVGDAKLWWAGSFAAIWLLSGLVIFFGSADPLDDYYTDVRKKLIGRWTIKIDTLRQERNGEWIDMTIEYPMEIRLDERTKKLAIDLDQQNSQIFKPNHFSTSVIHLSHTDADRYQFVFLLDARQVLRDGLNHPPGFKLIIPMQILFILGFRLRDGGIQWLEGQWFDLDNVIYPATFFNSSDPGRDKLAAKRGQTGGNFQSRVSIARAD